MEGKNSGYMRGSNKEGLRTAAPAKGTGLLLFARRAAQSMERVGA